MRYVEDIANLGMPDAEEAGGKGANMGEMVKAQLPVPPGFVLLRDSYLASMSAGGVADDLFAAHGVGMVVWVVGGVLGCGLFGVGVVVWAWGGAAKEKRDGLRE